MRGWQRFEAFPKDDLLWMLTWLGPFYTDQNAPSQRAVMGHIVPLYPSKNRSPRQLNRGQFPRPDQFTPSRARPVAFASGDVTALCTGMIFRNGKLITPRVALSSPEHFKVDFGAQRSLRLSEIPALDQRTALLSGDWLSMSRSACVALPESGGRTLLIPALEVLRWCYGSSSRLLQATLSGEVGAVIDQVRASGTLNGQEYSMTVPDEFPDMDAPMLARLALDENAARQARQVNLQIITGRDGQTYHFPRVTFPYSRPSDAQPWRSFAVLGRALNSQTYLVHRILHVGETPPFRAIYLPAPTQADSNQPADPDAAPRHRYAKPPLKNADGTRLHSNQEPRNPRTPRRLPALPAQFSDFTAVMHLPPESRPGGAPTIPRGTRAGQNFSTGLGSDSGSSLKRAVLTHDPRDDETPIFADYFVQLREAVKLLPEAEYTAAELPVNNPGGLEARFQNWRRENGQRVGCLLIEVQHQDHYFYLLDKELVTEAYGPLILAKKTDATRATNAEINAMMDSRAGLRKWPRQVSDWTLLHIRHQYASAGSYARGLQKHIASLNPA